MVIEPGRADRETPTVSGLRRADAESVHSIVTTESVRVPIVDAPLAIVRMDGILPSPPFDLLQGPAPRPDIAFRGVNHFTRRPRLPPHPRSIVEHYPVVC